MTADAFSLPSARARAVHAMPRASRRLAVRAAATAGDDELCAASLPTPSWQPPTREQMIERLESDEFDLLVIGGGATGAGVAMDAATRGLSVALVERGDFSSATSSRSTKLIHGGLRYLAQAFQSKIPPRSLFDVVANLRFDPDYLRIVAADLSERAWMIQSAPFMTKALPMMVPLYRWWEVPLFWIVGNLYDLIAGPGRGVPPSRIVSVDEARFQARALTSFPYRARPAASRRQSSKRAPIAHAARSRRRARALVATLRCPACEPPTPTATAWWAGS